MLPYSFSLSGHGQLRNACTSTATFNPVRQKVYKQPSQWIGHRFLAMGASGGESSPSTVAAPAAAPTKTWLNPDSAVEDFVEGLVATTQHLSRLDGFPEIKVVFHHGHDHNHVAVISVGEVFASPSAEAVLAAIRTVTGPAGCLVVIKNYTGDRLHFGLAAEQAKALGLKVEVVVVGEDVAIESPGLAGRRGLAGTALVHKLAGAAAARGASLEEVASVAQRAAESMATLGVSLGVCTLPGKPVAERLGADEVEVGLGIHGEPGQARAKLEPAPQLIKHLLKHIAKSPHCRGWVSKPGRRVALLVNNLGSSTALEMTVAAGAALKQLRDDLKLVVERVYVGPFVTSLDMHGLSLTLLDLDADLPSCKSGGEWDTLELLDAVADVPGWNPVGVKVAMDKATQPVPPAAEDEEDASATDNEAASPAGERLGRVLRAACEAIVKAAPGLNELDKKVGDGDCGDTVALGAKALLAELDAGRFHLSNAAATAARAALTVRRSVGGTSGALYGVLFTAVARSLKESGSAATSSPATWAAGFQSGVEMVSKYGGARAGSRTMLDALMPAAKALSEQAERGVDGVEAAKVAAHAAEEGAEATKTMAPAAGRASYVPREVTESVPDPGALAVSVWLHAIADALAA